MIGERNLNILENRVIEKEKDNTFENGNQNENDEEERISRVIVPVVIFGAFDLVRTYVPHYKTLFI